jgi:hypothetical protein
MSKRLRDMLDVQTFLTWLYGKPAREHVGVSRSKNHCPLATYLHEHGWRQVRVEADWVKAWEPPVAWGTAWPCTVTPPCWVDAFIHEVDRRGGNKHISALVARRIMARVARVA